MQDIKTSLCPVNISDLYLYIYIFIVKFPTYVIICVFALYRCCISSCFISNCTSCTFLLENKIISFIFILKIISNLLEYHLHQPFHHDLLVSSFSFYEVQEHHHHHHLLQHHHQLLVQHLHFLDSK